MTRGLFAVWALFIGSVIGFLGMVMFYNQAGVGISFLIFVTLVFAAVIGSARYARRAIHWRNMWPLVPILFFSGMLAVRASEWLQFWNVMATLALSGLVLHYMGLTKPLDLTSNLVQLAALIETGLRVGIGEPIMALVESSKWLGQREQSEVKHVGAVVRGVLITVPVLGVFAVLLASADAVFESYLNRIPNIFQFDNVEMLIEQAILFGILSWGVVGAITYAVMRHWKTDENGAQATAVKAEADETTEPDEEPETPAPPANETDATTPPKRGASFFRLGMIEGGMLLGGVNLLFGAFVLVQFVYLFGGRSSMIVEGMNFSEYARRGFFELVTAAVMSMGLILFVDRVTVREGKRESVLFRGLAFVMIGMVGIMLVSATRRMGLYTDAFGLTHLRLWTSVFMGWLVVLFGFLVAALLRLRTNIFSLGVMAAAIGFFVTMNFINPDMRIAQHNINRALEAGEDLDLCYLSFLSAGATPVIFEAYERAEGEIRDDLGTLLNTRWQHLQNQQKSGQAPRTWLAISVGELAEMTVLTLNAPNIENNFTMSDTCTYCYYRTSF